MGRHGENIHKRKDGRWEARIVQGKPVNGKTNYISLYGKTYQEVKNLKKEYYLKLAAKSIPCIVPSQTTGKPTSIHSSVISSASELSNNAAMCRDMTTFTLSHPLFRDAAEGWLSSKKAIVKESSFSYYTLMVRNHLLPALGDLPLTDITPQCLSDFLTAQKTRGSMKTGKPMKDKTVADLKGIIKQILSWANLHNMLESVPACPTIPVRQLPTSVLTRKEQDLLEAQLLKEDNPFCLGVWLTLYGGPRIGEICALKWEDIDFQNGTVQIRKTVNRIADVDSGTASGTRLIISSPKTECSMRSIPLPEKILSYFKERKKPGTRYVITGTSSFMEPRTCLARFKRLLQRAGIAEHTWHALRHTFATRCIESGVDVKSLSEIMGHSNVKMTMQRYVHPSMDAKKYQVNKLTCVMDYKDTDCQADHQIDRISGQTIHFINGQIRGQEIN